MTPRAKLALASFVIYVGALCAIAHVLASNL